MDIRKILGLLTGVGIIGSLVYAIFSDGHSPTLEELEEERERVQADYNNPTLDMDTRIRSHSRLFALDQQIGKMKWGDDDYGYPAHSEHGWHLPSDD
ncbi:MAG: hypothetical protein IJ168_04675 [Eubacterium sp.]|nr:hypothetical protein [Eubacterium sp.]